jgi:hypothetical protein
MRGQTLPDDDVGYMISAARALQLSQRRSQQRPHRHERRPAFRSELMDHGSTAGAVVWPQGHKARLKQESAQPPTAV